MDRSLTTLLLLTIGLSAAGCNATGTNLIRNGRAIYNESIIATNNEQLLSTIVHMRYQEPTGMLSVASITANVRIQANVGAQFGVGPESDFSGNLVPLTAGALYEENPTISYVPVKGQEHLRLMLSPLPLDLTVLLLSALGDSPAPAMLLMKEINGIRNPGFIHDDRTDETSRFASVAELLASLHRRGCLVWTQAPGDEPAFALLLRGRGEAYARDVTRLYELLGLGAPPDSGDVITLPALLAVGSDERVNVEIRTRSVFDLLKIAAASIDVPQSHLASGLAPPLPRPGPVVGEMRIRSSIDRPDQAMVAVTHHGRWYWIDATDGRSKRAFQILEAITTARISDGASDRDGRPVLTVPVSR